jgi:hypothetical protein
MRRKGTNAALVPHLEALGYKTELKNTKGPDGLTNQQALLLEVLQDYFTKHGPLSDSEFAFCFFCLSLACAARALADSPSLAHPPTVTVRATHTFEGTEYNIGSCLQDMRLKGSNAVLVPHLQPLGYKKFPSN